MTRHDAVFFFPLRADYINVSRRTRRRSVRAARGKRVSARKATRTRHAQALSRCTLFCLCVGGAGKEMLQIRKENAECDNG